MSNALTAYPFDPSGTLASNKITAEHQVISPPELSEFHFIIPAATPFFAESMVIVHLPSQRTLVEGVDFVLTHYFHDASLQCAKPIYGSLTFYNQQLSGAVRMTYQTLGGEWTLSSAKIIEILSNKLVNPRRVYWEQIADLPRTFPPIDHDWHLDDLVGMSEVVDVLEGIRDAIIASGDGGLQAHIADNNNPHNTDKTQIGLGLVENYPVATVNEAQTGTASNRYLTVLRGTQLVQALIGNQLSNHLGNSNNPHNTDKGQIGLSLVENYAVATQSQAEAGTLNNLYMTPLRTAQLVTVLIGNRLDTHIARTDNPHGTNKSHVGLALVQNYGIADVIAARLGTANDLYMTPAMTREAITAIAFQGLSDHIENTNNPHGTTAFQVGLGNVSNLSIASQPEAEAGSLNTRYMTPLRSRQLLQALIGNTLTTHINDSGNPHGTDKGQVGLANVDNYATASETQAVQGLATNLFMTPATTRALILALGGGGAGEGLQTHLLDLDNPHEVTKDQIGLGLVNNFATASLLQAQSGTANDLYMTPAGSTALINQLVGNVLSLHIAANNNPHNVTANQTGAYTQAQVDALLIGKLGTTEQAADSLLLDGHTYNEVISYAKTVEVYRSGLSGLGDVWILLGSVTIPSNIYAAPIPDVVGQITGGEPSAFGISSTFVVRLALRNLALSTATVSSENYSRDVRFGYTLTSVSGGNQLRLYSRGPSGQWPLTVTPLSQDDKFFVDTQTSTQVEPTGITYLPTQLPAFARQRTSFGDLPFGELPSPLNFEQINGPLVEWVSVVHSDADELVVQAIQNNLKEEYANFLPWSAANNNYLYDDLPILDKWGWDSVEQGILLDSDTLTGNVMLSAQDYSTNYEFEVELSSTNTASNGAGVIAAHATIANRPVAISVIRTPGGLTQIAGVPAGVPYKLKTIALHIGQIDAVDLGSENGGLSWSDTDIPNDGRDPTTYVATGNGWNTSGKVKIKVNRTGNILTIDVTEFGGSSYLAGEQVVIDFTAVSSLNALVNRPTSWGVISVKQPKVTFKVLNRPRIYRDYVRIGVAADNDKQRFYRFNGLIWEYTYLGINNPLVRPNRLYFSDWDGVLYQSQRNGRLRPILVEAYSRAAPLFWTS
jgi:hypothetical protein